MMLAASLALHVCVAGGIALSYFWSASRTATASPEPTNSATVTLVRTAAERVVSKAQPSAIKHAVPTVVATSSAVPLLPTVSKSLPTVTPVAQSSHEANPNVHIRALPPEAILSPIPPPSLHSAEGIVFILDVSGSMYEPYAGSTRLAFARDVLAERIRALKDGTPFAITLYAQRGYTSGPLVPANDATREAAVRFIMRDVDCGGGTNLPAGLAAAEQLHPGGLVLATDGDLNITARNLTTQALDILGTKGHCAQLEIVGIAPRANAGDEQLLEGLADQQGGSYAAMPSEDASQLVTSAAGVTKPAATTP